MAYDKVVDSGKLESDLKIVGDAIRAKGGASAPLEFPQGMADAVAAISGGGSAGTSFADFIEGKVSEVRNDTATEIASGSLTQTYYIKSLYFPEVIKINSEGCKENHNLTNIYFPKVQTIGSTAFLGSKISKVDFPVLKEIGHYVFLNNARLETVILRFDGVATLKDRNAFGNTPIEKGTGYIYVPKALMEQYKTATNWVAYAAQIRAIEDYPEITGGAK